MEGVGWSLEETAAHMIHLLCPHRGGCRMMLTDPFPQTMSSGSQQMRASR